MEEWTDQISEGQRAFPRAVVLDGRGFCPSRGHLEHFLAVTMGGGWFTRGI